MKLDGEKLLDAIADEIQALHKDAVQKSGLGWFESAAKAHLLAEGLIKARQMIRLGDYTIEDKG